MCGIFQYAAIKEFNYYDITYLCLSFNHNFSELHHFTMQKCDKLRLTFGKQSLSTFSFQYAHQGYALF